MPTCRLCGSLPHRPVQTTTVVILVMGMVIVGVVVLVEMVVVVVVVVVAGGGSGGDIGSGVSGDVSSMLVCLFYILATSKVIEWVPTCDSTHSW